MSLTKDYNYYKSITPGDLIQSKLVKYGTKRATEYIINKLMARPLKAQRNFVMRERENMRDLNARRRFRGRRIQRKRPLDGRYTGPFIFPNKKPRMVNDPVAKRGSRAHTEQNIPNCQGVGVAYIGFSSLIRRVNDSSVTTNLAPNHHLNAGMYHVAACILRYALKKTWNIEFERHDQQFNHVSLVGVPETGSVVLWSKKQPVSAGATGGSVVPYVDYHITSWVGTDTFASVADKMATLLLSKDFGARGYVIESTSPFTAYRPELYGVTVTNTFSGTTVSTSTGMLRLDNTYIRVNTKSIVYIQNQTTADSGALSTDVIDANPVHGKIFYFRDPAPEVRFDQNNNSTYTGVGEQKLMIDANADGIIYPNTTQIGTNTGPNQISAWNQIPQADMFKNLSKYSNFSLAPGEMKKISLTFKFDGLIQKFIEGHNLPNSTMVPGATTQLNNPSIYQTLNQKHALGTSILFAVEKRLSTGDGNVEIAVQRNVWCSAIIKKRRAPTMQPAAVGERVVEQDDTT